MYEQATYICPCCGFPGLKGPPYERLDSAGLVRGLRPRYSQHFGMPSYEVCPCCGFEFGNDDEPGTGTPESFEEYLAEWIMNGENWFNPAKKPSGWTLTAQLSAARVEHPSEE